MSSLRSVLQKPVTARFLVAAGTGLLAVASILIVLEPFWWGFELIGHFRAQLCIALVLGAGTCLFTKLKELALLQAGLTVWLVIPMLPLLSLPGDGPSLRPVGQRVRFLLSNVHTVNTRHDEVRSLVEEMEPDVFVALEVNDRWVAELGSLTEEHPHFVVEPRPDHFGIALYSRLPLLGQRVLFLGEAGIPTILATLDLGDGESLHVVAAHPVPPAGSAGTRMRDEILGELAQLLQRLPGPKVLIGDLNCTPWSPPYRRLLEESSMRDAARGQGIQATFPWPLVPLMIPIDRCLHSSGTRVLRYRTERAVGSDHLPLLVDLDV